MRGATVAGSSGLNPLQSNPLKPFSRGGVREAHPPLRGQPLDGHGRQRRAPGRLGLRLPERAEPQVSLRVLHALGGRQRGLHAEPPERHEHTVNNMITIMQYTVLCYAILCYTILYNYTRLYYTIRYYNMIYYAIIHYTMIGTNGTSGMNETIGMEEGPEQAADLFATNETQLIITTQEHFNELIHETHMNK